jgi:hypothetical protein
MNRDDIVRIAWNNGYMMLAMELDHMLPLFQAIVAAAKTEERERCAEICDSLADSLPMSENENVYLAARTIRNMGAE